MYRPERTSAWQLVLIVSLLSLCAAGCATVSAEDLASFTSDGCSLFPDGSIRYSATWCDCCLEHDIAYWQGGSKEDRLRADKTLRACVIKRTGSKTLAAMMYEGVRAGGHPAFPTWYRWGYGWKYGKGYAKLTEQEDQQVRARLDAYRTKHPLGYCGETHGGAK